LQTTIPAPPEFGQAAPYGQVSPETLALLAQRRSSSPRDLTEPAPEGEQLQDLLRLAARAPDHGKLFPWRFIILKGAAKAALADRFEALAKERPDSDKAAGVLFKLRLPPLAVLVVSRVVESNIPAWEQQLSAGAVCQNLVLAGTAMGYGVNWITDWYSFDPRATALLGIQSNEQIAGVMLIGTPTEAPLERARPDIDAITTVWSG
jgi:nitroreductase